MIHTILIDGGPGRRDWRSARLSLSPCRRRWRPEGLTDEGSRRLAGERAKFAKL